MSLTTALTKTQMIALIESDIIHRSDKSTLVGFALNWALEYLDKSGTFAELCQEQVTTTTISCTFATTDVNTTTNIITTSIDIPTGTKIVFTSTTTVPAGLVSGTEYWCIRQSSTTIKVASTYLAAWQGTAIDITDTGTGTHTVKAYRERIAKPDLCKYIQSVRLIDNNMSRKLEPIMPNQIDLYVPFAATNSPARPTNYIEWKDWLQLYPIPDDTYVITIRYIKWQDAFDEVGDKAEIDHIDDLIVKAACVHIWDMLGEPEQSAIMQRAVEVGLAKQKRFVEKMKPDLVLKPSMGSVRESASDKQTNPWSNG